jgi:hypothetical protein
MEETHRVEIGKVTHELEMERCRADATMAAYTCVRARAEEPRTHKAHVPTSRHNPARNLLPSRTVFPFALSYRRACARIAPRPSRVGRRH